MIRIKILAKRPVSAFHFGPLVKPPAGFSFILDPQARSYDWLLVYDDLPSRGGERFPMSDEVLACPPEKTMLLTYEPSSIKLYGRDYTRQFGMVLTSHEPSRLAHPMRRNVPPVSVWYYGDDADIDIAPCNKTQSMSFFASAKSEGHTMHRLRYDFSAQLQDYFGARAEIFGRPHRYIEKKNAALDTFKYTVALENHIAEHHWTEKISDAFLGLSFPFYAGCPNLFSYFPAESFQPIDMRDAAAAIEIIEAAQKTDLYDKSLPALVEARRRVIENYGLAHFVATAIDAAEGRPAPYVPQNGGRIVSRRRMRLGSPIAFLRYAFEKAENRRYFHRQMQAYRATVKTM